MPTFRYRQQESYVLSTFDFGENMYPLIEIVKEFDRSRKIQKEFEDIYIPAVKKINAKHVFVDLPIYLKQAKSVKPEVTSFIIKVINNLKVRCEYINKFASISDKVIPVISSYYDKRKQKNTILEQVEILRPNFKKLAFRIYLTSFEEDFSEIVKIATPEDYIILDLDRTGPYITRPLKGIFDSFISFNIGTKIILRSAINTDIENVKLEHGRVVLEADNSHIERTVFSSLGADAVGDYVGIKKDNLTEGGSISPGFIYFDAIKNQFYGFKASKKDLDEFKDTIIPAVLKSLPTQEMLLANPPFLNSDNWGYKTILNIFNGNESGKNQAKFKRITMEHYLYCIKILIQKGIL